MVLTFSAANAQDNKAEDSVRINSLKAKLKTATGRAEVDLLNDLSWEYLWNGLDKTYKTNADYAYQAKAKAEKLKYKRGVGFALINISWTKQNENCDSLINAAINIGQQEKDYKLVGRGFHRRWDMKAAYENFKKAGDKQGEAEAATYLCDEYSKKGQYGSDGFKYCQRAVELAELKKVETPGHSKFISTLSYQTMSELFSKVGDYQTAFNYLTKTGADESIRKAELYKQMGKYDSALLYYEKAYDINPNVRGLNRQVGTINLLNKNYNKAIEHLERSLDFVNKNKAQMQFPINYLGSLQVELGEAYTGLNNFTKAKEHFEAAITEQRPNYYRLTTPNKSFTDYQRQNLLMELSQGLSKSYYGLKSIDSAYTFLQHHVEHKDRVAYLNTLWRLSMQLSSYKKIAEDQKRTSQLQLLQKDNQLSQAKLKQETTLRNSLLIGLLLLLLISFVTFRTLHFRRKAEGLRAAQLENELQVKELEGRQKQTQLQQKATELEMQALRAQMNPHFIFNCLSSINRFVLKNETEAASDYLTRFSRLIRMVLINSQKSTITLEDELEMLRLYLDMERLRFKHSFDYNIIFCNTVDAGNIFIPPLLLQPFCENAIWHGLMHKEGQGKLDINLRMEKNVLHCAITDNGIGRKKAAELKSKSGEKNKSFGLKITTDRLALLNENQNVQTFYKMHDLVDENGNAEGTSVELQIRYKEEITELV